MEPRQAVLALLAASRRDLMKRLAQIAKAQGVEMHITEGGNHTKVSIGDRAQIVPRHNEINEMTAKEIIRQLEGRP